MPASNLISSQPRAGESKASPLYPLRVRAALLVKGHLRGCEGCSNQATFRVRGIGMMLASSRMRFGSVKSRDFCCVVQSSSLPRFCVHAAAKLRTVLPGV